MFTRLKNFWRKITGTTHKDPVVIEDVRRTVDDAHLPINLPPAVKEGDEYKVWIPFAENVHDTKNLKMRSRGEFADGYPEGIVIHWTSGWHLVRGLHINPFPMMNNKEKLASSARKYALQTLSGGIKNGYNFLVMDVLGKIYQSRPLTKWGYHAGKSYWPGVGYSVSNKLVGVEMLNPSTAKRSGNKFYTWFKYELPEILLRQTNKGIFYHYSLEQEESLLKLCIWLYRNSPVVDGEKVFKIANVVGHAEVSPGRKSDPGDALSMSMAEFRSNLRTELGI